MEHQITLKDVDIKRLCNSRTIISSKKDKKRLDITTYVDSFGIASIKFEVLYGDTVVYKSPSLNIAIDNYNKL